MRRWVLVGGVGVSVLTVLLAARWWSDRTTDVTATIDGTSIVLLGDSITHGGDWSSLLPDVPVVNHGHPGFTTEQLVPIADEIADRGPNAVFVLTGTNDIRDARPPAWSRAHLTELLDAFAEQSPTTTVVVQTVLPRADAPDQVRALNVMIEEVAVERGLPVLDLHGTFDDGSGGLRPDETDDGVHLTPEGYRRWADVLRDAVASLGAPAA